MYGNTAARLRQLRTSLDAADAVARHLCTCPLTAGEAHPLLLKLDSIRAELARLELLEAPSAVTPAFPFPITELLQNRR